MGKRREKRKGKRWSYTAGSYPHSVRVFERGRGGVLYVSAWDPTVRREVKRSLGHRNREASKAYADEQAAKLRQGMDDVRAARPTADRIFRLYRAHRTPDKSSKMQQEDVRQIDMWTTFLGADFDLSKLSRREWDFFNRHRRSGEIDSHGNPVPKKDDRLPVGNRVVQKDLSFLRTVCLWATQFRDSGRLLLNSDPTRGYDAPVEKNPNRPLASHDRVDAIRRVHQRITMRSRGAKGETVESWLPEIFEVVVGTGRRIAAVRSLRVADLDLERTAAAPHGAIVWPEDFDKMGKRWRCPINAEVQDAVESAIRKRQRLGHVGGGWLFPAPHDPRQPVRYEQISRWLRQAEKLAKLKPLKGGAWHPYRRLWATARKGLEDVDVCAAGGWSSPEALKKAYQAPDDATMLRVVLHQTELREVK